MDIANFHNHGKSHFYWNLLFLFPDSTTEFSLSPGQLLFNLCLLIKSGDFEMHTSNQKQIERQTRKQALQIYAQ